MRGRELLWGDKLSIYRARVWAQLSGESTGRKIWKLFRIHTTFLSSWSMRRVLLIFSFERSPSLRAAFQHDGVEKERRLNYKVDIHFLNSKKYGRLKLNTGAKINWHCSAMQALHLHGAIPLIVTCWLLKCMVDGAKKWRSIFHFQFPFSVNKSKKCPLKFQSCVQWPAECKVPPSTHSH